MRARSARLGEQVPAQLAGTEIPELTAVRLIHHQANRTRKLPPDAGGPYLAQPEMRALVQEALELGFQLFAYEAPIGQEPRELKAQPRSLRPELAGLVKETSSAAKGFLVEEGPSFARRRAVDAVIISAENGLE